MKRIISLILMVICLTAVCCSCAAEPEEKIQWLPYELEFGMTYDEAVKLNADMPELQDATANDGYFCGTEYIDAEEANSFFNTDVFGAFSFPSYAYSFNENKELYELMFLAEMSSESDGEEALNSLKSYYDEMFGFNGIEGDGLEYEWVNDELSCYLCVYTNGDDYRVYLCLHEFEHELQD